MPSCGGSQVGGRPNALVEIRGGAGWLQWAASGHVPLNWVEAQLARWCADAPVRSGHAQQRTLLWLGHPPLGLDMVCPSRLDVACHVKVVVTYISRRVPLGWQVEVLTNSTSFLVPIPA